MNDKQSESLPVSASAGVAVRRLNFVSGALVLGLHVLVIFALLMMSGQVMPVPKDETSIEVSIIPIADLSEARPWIQPDPVRVKAPVVYAPELNIEPEPSPITVDAQATPASMAAGYGASETGRSDYIDRIRRHLERFMVPAKGIGTATLKFFISRDGMLRSVSIVTSSGNAAVDNEALSLMARAQPLPPIPDELKTDSFGAIVPVSYQAMARATGR